MPAKKKPVKKGKVEEEVSDRPRSVKRRKDCPDCGSGNIIFDPETEQLICQDCGLIFEELPADIEKKYEQVDDL
jgi:ribosomal protein S27E